MHSQPFAVKRLEVVWQNLQDSRG